jgi:NAD+ synthase
MPIHQNPTEVTRAQMHIQALQAKYPNVIHHNIDLTDTYETLKKTMNVIGKTEDELYMSLVNTRSRLRMVTLYAVGQANQGLVL